MSHRQTSFDKSLLRAGTVCQGKCLRQRIYTMNRESIPFSKLEKGQFFDSKKEDLVGLLVRGFLTNFIDLFFLS